MGKLYLASFQFKAQNGELVNDQRLIHADIKDHLNEHQKALKLTDWAADWFEGTYKGIELTGCKVATTLEWEAPMDENKKSKERWSVDSEPDPFDDLRSKIEDAIIIKDDVYQYLNYYETGWNQALGFVISCIEGNKVEGYEKSRDRWSMKEFTKQDMLDFVKYYDCKPQEKCHKTFEAEFDEWLHSKQ